MALSQSQKVDFLLKKIGYTASKTGFSQDGGLGASKKAGFAEAIPSPLKIADSVAASSGRLVPRAKIVKPIITSEIPIEAASFSAYITVKLE